MTGSEIYALLAAKREKERAETGRLPYAQLFELLCRAGCRAGTTYEKERSALIKLRKYSRDLIAAQHKVFDDD